MEGELGSASYHLQRSVRIVDAGHLDDDSPVPRGLEGRLGDAERVHATTQDLESSCRDVAVHCDVGGVLGLEDDLSPTSQVETEVDRSVQDYVDGSTDRDDRPEEAPP